MHVHEPFYDYIMAIHLEPAAIQSGLAATALDLVQSLCSPIEETSYDDTRSELVVESMQLLTKRFIDRKQKILLLNNLYVLAKWTEASDKQIHKVTYTELAI